MDATPGTLDRCAQLLVAAQNGRGVSGGAALVFCALLLHAQVSGGVARPSVEALVTMTGLDRRNVQRALAALTECGAIAPVDDQRSSGGRGRITRWHVAPHAIRGDAAALCRRHTAAGSPQIAEENCGDSAADDLDNRGDPAADSDGNRGADCAKPRRQRRPNRIEQNYPPTPQGDGERSARGPEPSERGRAMLSTLEHAGPVANPFAARTRLTEFARNGGDEADLRRLMRCAMRADHAARNPVALVLHWLAEEQSWRAVLDQDRSRVRERALRRRAPSVGQPAPMRELMDMPARRVGE
ncbi:MAG TPA: helix-turn-helix domain-containing protein [Planctomycetota bacterium]|nr:helix-turn-helix domain-containing protein [Planctomycetota bacterium]